MSSADGPQTAAAKPLPEIASVSNDALIADAAELENFASNPISPLTPQIKGVIAETALTSLVRYPWSLLLPVLHRLLDTALDSFSNELAADEAGPPRPMPNGGTLSDARTSLHSLLDEFSAPPFTLQRLCEILLEPIKQYHRVDKFVLAVERLLLITSTIHVTVNPPPRPTLSSLGPVNENPPSPYDGEPPAGPPPDLEDKLRSLGNGMLQHEEYEMNAIFIGAEMPQHNAELVAGEAGPMRGESPHERVPPPMGPAEVLQAEAFVQAALAATPPDDADLEASRRSGGGGQVAGGDQVRLVEGTIGVGGKEQCDGPSARDSHAVAAAMEEARPPQEDVEEKQRPVEQNGTGQQGSAQPRGLADAGTHPGSAKGGAAEDPSAVAGGSTAEDSAAPMETEQSPDNPALVAAANANTAP